jgi:putative phosphoribosyl transferase
VDPPIVFADRADAGRRLAAHLATLDLLSRSGPDALVCGIPRGGVVVAAEVARALGLPLRAVVARKVGAPGQQELAIGAVGPDGTAVLDDELVRLVGADERWLESALARARAEVAERVATLPGAVDADSVRGRTVLVVDDGVATGSTAAAVGRWLGHAGAGRRVLALPTAPPDVELRLGDEYDEVIALSQPRDFVAVGQWYRRFGQTSDAEVREILGRAT